MPSTTPSSPADSGKSAAESAAGGFSGTVVIELDSETDRAVALAQAAYWAERQIACRIADAVGLDEGETDPPGVQRFPVESLPSRVSRYRMALTATGDWVLFLKPTQSVPPSFLQAIPTLPDFPGAYRLPRILRQDDTTIATFSPIPDESPALVPRQAFLNAETASHGLPVTVFPQALWESLPPDGSTRWLASEAELLVNSDQITAARLGWQLAFCLLGGVLTARWAGRLQREGWLMSALRLQTAMARLQARENRP